MSGYIEYNDLSHFSPLYLHPVSIGESTFSSAQEAINQGIDPYDAILNLVRTYRDIYYPYRRYVFKGTHSDLINRAIQELYIPSVEERNIDWYMSPVGKDMVQSLPREYGIPIRRDIYTMQKVGSDRYKPVRSLGITEVYNVYMIEDIPLYVGSNGAFFLLSSPDQDIRAAIQALQR